MLVRLVGTERIVNSSSGRMRRDFFKIVFCIYRYKNFVLLPLSKRRFCQECQQLLLPDEWEKHLSHQFLSDISTAQLRSPSQLLYPLENKKTNAQYLFADRSCQFLLDLIISLGFRRVLSVGTPRYV
ncbi:hypothetical protein CIB84_013756 [Bambusicola thoracicus]|uniref:Uncharacterized protein n=1 Tax=Bambusicola thoracicus TaxID=9083 RepID=A0A2P4SEF8_BAMTH|nr:hypothetical protein CIB84_013756 [Bambusicola thoracicus]